MASERVWGEDKVPEWKRELICRRREGKGKDQLGGGAGASSVGKMRLLEADLSSELVVNKPHIMVEEKPGKKPVFRRLKTIPLPAEEEYHSDSSEELQYGPGIVNKLKTKYLSMTLRENQKRNVRPSLSNLRRATSLENMLDEDSAKPQPKIQFVKKTVFSDNQKKLPYPHSKYLALNRGSDSMKRARSMDTLLRNETKCISAQMKKTVIYETGGLTNGSIAPSIINEDLVIVESVPSKEEKCNKVCVSVAEKELPPPDLVKQTLKIFEPAGTALAAKKGKESSIHAKPKVVKPPLNNKPPTLPKVHMEKHKCRQVKPVVSPKPVLIPDKRIVRPSQLHKQVIPVVTTASTQNVKPLTVSVENEKSPVSPNGFSPNNVSPVPFNCTGKSENLTGKSENHTGKSENHTGKSENHTETEELTSKYISRSALDNIGKEGTTVKFCFNDSINISSNKSHLPKQEIAQATNTALISSQAAERPLKSPELPPTPPPPPPPVKQIAIIRPVVTNKTQTQGLTDQEIEKNHINRVKSIEPTKVLAFKQEIDVIEKKNNVSGSEKTELWDKKAWQNQNSVVFNFSDRKSIPDYIENDGLILASRRIRCNGVEEEVDSGSPEEDNEPPSPCNIRFIGDNIVINGKSNLRKEPKQQKLRIQFNDEATTLFEYPSEESMNEEITNMSNITSNTTSLSIGGGSLSNYTPCKTETADGFELGVTRVAPTPPTPVRCPSLSPQAEDYLKPADSNTPWSHETAADILF